MQTKADGGLDPTLVTILIPARNEEANVPHVQARLAAVSANLPYQFEFIVIDNGSTDETGQLVQGLCAVDPRWKYVRFSRDFGVEASLAAGYRLAGGDAIVVLYSDLQDPPEVIPEMLTKWRDGFDVVYGVRTSREGDPKWRNLAARLAYRIISALAEVRIPRDTGDFRLITAQVRDALLQCEERNRYTRGLIAWLGFRQVGVQYVRQPRQVGDSKAPLGALLTFMLNAITSFSIRPLRLFMWLGFLLVGLSVLAVLIYIGLYATGDPPPGLTTLIILSLAAIGINSLGIGVLGEYLGRTYAEAKHRPLYVIAETTNIDAPTDESTLPTDSARDSLWGDNA